MSLPRKGYLDTYTCPGLKDPRIFEYLKSDELENWAEIFSHTQLSLLSIVRGVVANPEVMCIHKPTLNFDEVLGTRILKLLKTFVVEKGVLQDYGVALGELHGRNREIQGKSMENPREPKKNLRETRFPGFSPVFPRISMDFRRFSLYIFGFSHIARQVQLHMQDPTMIHLRRPPRLSVGVVVHHEPRNAP